MSSFVLSVFGDGRISRVIVCIRYIYRPRHSRYLLVFRLVRLPLRGNGMGRLWEYSQSQIPTPPGLSGS